MMQRDNCKSNVLVAICCCLLLALPSTPAPARRAAEEGGNAVTINKASNSPQFLYMKRLHERIKDSKVDVDPAVELKDEQTSGTLIATSFEASTDINGTGWNTSGVTFNTGNQLTLSFIIPNPGNSISIQETDLWLFPDPSNLRNDSVTDLTLLIVVELSHANKPRREVMNYSWRMDSTCMRLNLTGLSRKVVNNLQKRGLEKTNISVSIEVVTARDPEPVQGTMALDVDLQEGCTALRQRGSNTPFLVMKYYDENRLTSVTFSETHSDEESTTSTQNRPQKRQSSSDASSIESDDDSSTTESPSATSSNGCAVVPLKVNLTKIFGDFILLPTEMHINDCYGSCESGQSSEDFTLHSRIKEQIKLIEGEDRLQRSENCCAPSSYEQRDLLIRKENYIAIVGFPDMVVTGCKCK